MSSINFNNNKFNGSINGKRASDYYRLALKKGSSEIKSKEYELKKINNILGTEVIDGVEFYDEFWTKVFLQNDEDEYCGSIKLILNKDDNLYSDSNIAQTLEFLGTCILRSEKKKDNPEQYIRVFHSKEMYLKAVKEYDELRKIIENTSEGKYAEENGLDDLFVLVNQMNYKREKTWRELDDKHLKKLDEEYGTKYTQVHDYYTGYLKMKDKLHEYKAIQSKRKLTHDESIQCKLVNKNVKSLKDDFLECINKKSRPIVFKNPLPDEGYPSWNEYDETDIEHLRYALQLPRTNDLQTDTGVIARDIDTTIDLCEFTEIQYKVLKMYRKGISQYEISNELNMDISLVNRNINAILKKISEKNWGLLENIYYLNICKGSYSKCSKCGQIKLASQFSKKGDRLQSQCKQCQRK